RDLIVQAPQRAASRGMRDARLHEARRQAVPRELGGAPCPREEAAPVCVPLGLDDPRAGDGRFPEDHGSTFTSGMGTTNRPPQSRTWAICSTISAVRFHGRIST